MPKVRSGRKIFCCVMTCYYPTLVEYGGLDKASVNNLPWIREQKI
jgi:hypothetical protein